MPKGVKKGDVLSPFSDRIDELRAQALAQATAFQGSGFRPWNIPEDIDAQNLFDDLDTLHGDTDKGFDRTEINTRYKTCFQDPSSPGTGGDVMGLKIQMDWLAAAERAFRFRHASTARLLTHAMCRRYFHGKGPVFSFTRTAVANLIEAGAVG